MWVKRLVSPVVDSLKSFEGNAKACILVEPLWAIPFNLFTTYTSLYMLALGVSVKQIGLIAAAATVMQTCCCFAAGWITDRLGRRKTSFYFDLVAWTLPTLIWTFAQGFSWFFVAAILNGFGRLVHVAWTCLFIEDARKETRVTLYAWMAVAGTLSGFFAPLAGLLVGRLGIVPATRILYALAFFMMTAMFIIRNALTKETAIGLIKIEESKTKSLGSFFRDYGQVFKALFTKRATTIAFLLAVIANIHLVIRNNFLSVVLTNGVGLQAKMIAVFPPLASALSLAAYFLIIPRLKNIRKGLLLALGANVAGNLVLFFAPAGSVLAVTMATISIALGMGVSGPVTDAILANSLDDSSRAVASSLSFTLMLALSAPFGWIAGLAASVNARLPAFLAAALMFLAMLLTIKLKTEK